MAAGDRFDDDMNDEVRLHLELRANDLVSRGLSPADARRQARVEFGSLEAVKEQLRETRPLGAWRRVPGSVWLDTRIALRRLRHAPVFTIFAIVSLALGVGGTSAAYSLIQALMWPSLGIRDTSTAALVVGRVSQDRLAWRGVMTRADFEDLRRQQTQLGSLAAAANFYATLADDAVAEAVTGEAVSGAFFGVLGVGPLKGRVLQPTDDTAVAASVVVVSESFWRTKLGADPDVVGRVVRLGGRPFEIVGVAAADFAGLTRISQSQRRVHLWIPLSALGRIRGDTSAADVSNRAVRALSVVGRVSSPDATKSAAAELEILAANLDRASPMRLVRSDGTDVVPRGWTVRAIDTEQAESVASAGPIGLAAVTLVALILVVASTNLANLVLSRGIGRMHEITVRRALGASRARLVRGLAVENVIVGLAGGALSLLVARTLTVAVASNISISGVTVIEMFDPQMNVSVLLFAAAAVSLALFVFGLVPAMRLTRQERRNPIAPRVGGGGMRWRGRRHLVRGQVAISTALFLVAAACVSVVVQSAHYDPGVALDRLAVAETHFRLNRWDVGRSRQAMDNILQQVGSQPGVTGAAAAASLPFAQGGAIGARLVVPGGSLTLEDPDAEFAYVVAGTTSLLDVLGVPLRAGRLFDERDQAGAPAVVVLSRTVALRLFGTEDAVGRQVLLKAELNATDTTAVQTLQVAGVVGDTDSGQFGRRRAGVVYVPLSQFWEPPRFILARTDDAPADLVTDLRTAIRRAEPDLAISASGTGLAVLASAVHALRTMAAVTIGLGTFALVLTLVGLYGVLSHLVLGRTREIGVRLALGASPGELQRMVLGDGLRPVASGLAIGILFGAIGRFLMRGWFGPGLSALDPAIFLLGPVPLVIGGLVACYWPARRAARIDPIQALRVE